MLFDKKNLLVQIQQRIADLQTQHVRLLEQQQILSQNADKQVHTIGLQLIDILDMIQVMPTTDQDSNRTQTLLIQKIEKRLNKILNSLNITEIIFSSGMAEPNKAKVVESRSDFKDLPSSTVLEICRKGYQRGEKIIRPAEVITVA